MRQSYPEPKMKQYLSKQNLPMILVVAMVVWAWISLLSVLIAGAF